MLNLGTTDKITSYTFDLLSSSSKTHLFLFGSWNNTVCFSILDVNAYGSGADNNNTKTYTSTAYSKNLASLGTITLKVTHAGTYTRIEISGLAAWGSYTIISPWELKVV